MRLEWPELSIVMFMPNFAKIRQLVQKLKDTQHSNSISILFLS